MLVLIKAILHQDRQEIQSQQQRAQLIRIQAATLLKLMPPEATIEEALGGVDLGEEETAENGGNQ